MKLKPLTEARIGEIYGSIGICDDVVIALSRAIETELQKQLDAPDDDIAELEIAAPQALASAIPEGWKLVPVEPTDEMLVAGQEAWAIIKPMRNAIEDCEEAVCVYRAMLAAAPEGAA